jgi:hypothetical protein
LFIGLDIAAQNADEQSAAGQCNSRMMITLDRAATVSIILLSFPTTAALTKFTQRRFDDYD